MTRLFNLHGRSLVMPCAHSSGMAHTLEQFGHLHYWQFQFILNTKYRNVFSFRWTDLWYDDN